MWKFSTEWFGVDILPPKHLGMSARDDCLQSEGSRVDLGCNPLHGHRLVLVGRPSCFGCTVPNLLVVL